MAGLKTEVRGVRETVKSLTGLGDAAHEQEPTMRGAAQDAARRVTGIPVSTGRLARSVGVLLVGNYGFVIGTKGVPYAHYVFGGTRYMAARAPKVPANMASDVAGRLGQNIVRGAR